jgi:cyclohexanone monooxygenase
VEKYDLRKYMQFNTELLSATWDDSKSVWRIEVCTGETFTARYLITALGLLSKQNYPDIKGIENYKGEMHHTAKWPQGFDFTASARASLDPDRRACK